MAKQKSDNPRVPVALRLRESIVELWKSTGSDWRGRMEDLLSRGPVQEDAAAPTRAAPQRKRAKAEGYQPGPDVKPIDHEALGVPVLDRDARKAAFVASQKGKK